MNESYLIVRRNPYEEPYCLNLEIFASNGSFAGRSTEWYGRVEDLRTIGTALQSFPRFIGDEYIFQYGSEKPEDPTTEYFSLRASTIDSLGHCTLCIRINSNYTARDEGACRFSIRCEPWSLARLGSLFIAFARLQHLEFKWVPDMGFEEMYEQHQSPPDSNIP